MLVDVALDGGLQVDDGMEDAALQALSGQGGEEVFDGVEPGTGCRREVEDPSGMTLEPGHDFLMFVRSVVVEDDMDHLTWRHVTLDGVEKADELLMAMSLHTPADDGSVQDIECGEQGGRAVSDIIVGHGSAFAGLERQARLGAVERLDLRLLVNRQDQRMGGRRHVETDDIFELGDKVELVRALERPEAMRLQLMRLPDPLYRAQRNTHDLGHGTASPVRDLTRWFAASQRDQPLNIGVRHRRLARLSAAFTQKSINTRLGIPPLPAPDRRAADIGKPGNLSDVQSVGRMQNDPRTGHMLLGAVTIGEDRFQANTILSRDKGAYSLGHADGIAYPTDNVNPMNASVH